MKSAPFASLLFGTIAALSFSSPASALGIHTFGVNMDGSQEFPPVVTPGVAGCTVTLDDVTGAVTVTGSFFGLTSNATLAHVHGPAAPGANAGILITLTENGGISGNVSGGGTLSPANITNMLNGLTYLNIHTSNNPGGELRGQITTTVPALPWGWVGALVVLALVGGACLLGRQPRLTSAV